MQSFKKTICAILLFLAVLPAFAAGRYTPGLVSVIDYAVPGQTYISADYNVRYNPNAGVNSFITVQLTPNLITVTGTDSDEAKNFFCTITTSNTIFTKAFDMAKNLRNGSSVLVYKDNATSKCTSFSMTNASDKTD